MSEGRNVADTGFDASLGRDFDDVVITLTDKQAEMTGVVRDSRGPVAAAVIAFPSSASAGRTTAGALRASDRRNRVDGRLPDPAAARGRLLLIAVDGSKVNAWTDPKFLAAAVPQADPISIKWGDKRTQDLTLVEVVVK